MALERLGWRPADDAQRAAVAFACEDWDAVNACGSAAVAPLLEFAADRPSRDAALGALERLLRSESNARFTAEQLESIVQAVEAIARPGSSRRLMAGSALKHTVVCRRIAQLARTALSRGPLPHGRGSVL